MWLESWIYKLPLRLRSIFRRSRAEADLDEELRFHMEQHAATAAVTGVPPAEARNAAMRAMHGFEQRKEECRDARGLLLLENFGRDLRYACRMLRKSPVFTSVAILSMALGIGANTAIFSLIDALLLQPLPVAHPEELRSIAVDTGEGRAQYAFTYPMFQSLRSHSAFFSNVFSWASHRFQMRGPSEMVHVNGALASGNYFSALGVPPVLGRTFTPADDHPSGGDDGPVAVISHRFWLEQFGGSPAAVGSGITLDRVRFTIIGVMPSDFFGAEVGTRPAIWVPLSLASRIDDPACINSRSCWWLIVMSRLKPGVLAAQAEGRLRVVSPQILRETVPTSWGSSQQQKYLHWNFVSSPGRQGWTFLRVQFSDPLAILMSLVVFVLLIACANMANLLLARASARHREIAVRLSMGAGRFRIVRQLLTESALLSAFGGAVGVLFAIWLTKIITAFVSSDQSGPASFTRLELHPDWRVIVFTVAVAVGSGLLFGLAPALRATGAGIAVSLKESTHTLRGGERFGVGRLTLPLQAALSVLLVAAAGLFGGSLYRILTQDPGFNGENVSLITVDTDKRAEKGAALTDVYTRLLERANGLPGVKAASLLWFTPLTHSGWDESLGIPGRHDLSEQQRDTYINLIGPRFFEAMQISLLAGRHFLESDTPASEKVGILNELAAQRFFGRRNPVGEHITLEGRVIRIVGVARSIKYLSLRDPEPLELYLPFTQKSDSLPSLTFVLRTAEGAPPVYPAFRAALHEIAPDVPIGLAKTMEEQINDSVGRERLMASLSVFFGVLALLITAIGLYGILAYGVSRRKGEIGIRLALGAKSRNVVWLVLREAAAYVTSGIAIGILAVLAVSRLVASLLYGVEPNDSGNLVAAVLALLLVSLASALVPALRASRLDPTLSLRQE